MRHQPKKLRDRPYFVHDENLEFKRLRKECNTGALFKSVVQLMKMQGAKDPEVIAESNKHDFHVITHNTQDFRNPPPTTKIGIICVGLLSDEDWIPKFSKMLKELPKHNDYYYKTIFIENTIIVVSRKTGEKKLIG